MFKLMDKKLIAILCLNILLNWPYDDMSSKARGLNFGPSLHLHPYFVDASSEGSGESAHRADSSGPSLADDAVSYSAKILCTDRYIMGT